LYASLNEISVLIMYDLTGQVRFSHKHTTYCHIAALRLIIACDQCRNVNFSVCTINQRFHYDPKSRGAEIND